MVPRTEEEWELANDWKHSGGDFWVSGHPAPRRMRSWLVGHHVDGEGSVAHTQDGVSGAPGSRIRARRLTSVWFWTHGPGSGQPLKHSGYGVFSAWQPCSDGEATATAMATAMAIQAGPYIPCVPRIPSAPTCSSSTRAGRVRTPSPMRWTTSYECRRVCKSTRNHAGNTCHTGKPPTCA